MAKNNNPFEITQAEWDDPDYEHYDKVFVEYDSDKDTLTELNGIMYDEEDRSAIGNDNIRTLIDSSDGVILVRNDRLEIDYEITK